ncbi:MAG: hypothetical protein ACO20T_10285 [Ilumatobacteraceae bacterium]
MRLQVTIDAKDPHHLVHFWAQALGYRAMIEIRSVLTHLLDL